MCWLCEARRELAGALAAERWPVDEAPMPLREVGAEPPEQAAPQPAVVRPQSGSP